MPMATKELQREHARVWIAKRRASFFVDKKCEWCGSTEKLQLHHLDKSTKTSHKIWSWTESRRVEEIAKCIVLCKACHTKHHNEERKTFVHGIPSTYKKGCRCELCGRAEYLRRHQRKQKP